MNLFLNVVFERGRRMIKIFPPTDWQVFIDQDSDITKFEMLVSHFCDDYTKMDDVVDGKLGTRFTFVSKLDKSTVESLINLFLK